MGLLLTGIIEHLLQPLFDVKEHTHRLAVLVSGEAVTDLSGLGEEKRRMMMTIVWGGMYVLAISKRSQDNYWHISSVLVYSVSYLWVRTTVPGHLQQQGH